MLSDAEKVRYRWRQRQWVVRCSAAAGPLLAAGRQGHSSRQGNEAIRGATSPATECHKRKESGMGGGDQREVSKSSCDSPVP